MKKKNTYIVQFSTFANSQLFDLCPCTPLTVVNKNGQRIANSGSFFASTDFPNPAAHNMTLAYEHLRPVMGERLACTIVEYLDKYTNTPVAYLFPTNEIDARPDFMSRLNHASRQDLRRQMAIRQKLLRFVNMAQR